MGELWHRILAHINYRALPTSRNIVIHLPALHMDHDRVCRGCALGKNTNGSFSNGDCKSKDILNLVHFDLCGPMVVASLGGYNY